MLFASYNLQYTLYSTQYTIRDVGFHPRETRKRPKYPKLYLDISRKGVIHRKVLGDIDKSSNTALMK